MCYVINLRKTTKGRQVRKYLNDGRLKNTYLSGAPNLAPMAQGKAYPQLPKLIAAKKERGWSNRK